MVHVLDEQDVVVERFFVFGVTRGGGGGGGFLGDEFKGFEHGFVEFGVGVVEVGADGEGGDDGRGGDHVLDCGGEVGEGFHKGDDAFALLDLDFRVLDAADLLVDEAREESDEAVVNPCEGCGEEFLVGVFELGEFGFDGQEDADALEGVLLDYPVDHGLQVCGEGDVDLFHHAVDFASHIAVGVEELLLG